MALLQPDISPGVSGGSEVGKMDYDKLTDEEYDALLMEHADPRWLAAQEESHEAD